MIYNTSQGYPADTPANATVRARYAAFFADGGGYVGAGVNGTSFVARETGGAQLAGLEAEWQGKSSQAGKATEDVESLLDAFGRVTPAFQAGVSGIVLWDNEGRGTARSPALIPSVTRRSSRTRCGSPRCRTTWPWTGACRRPATSRPAIGRPPIRPRAARRSSSTGATPRHRRITLFGIDPLFRAHPERSFPAVSESFYWGDI